MTIKKQTNIKTDIFAESGNSFHHFQQNRKKMQLDKTIHTLQSHTSVSAHTH